MRRHSLITWGVFALLLLGGTGIIHAAAAVTPGYDDVLSWNPLALVLGFVNGTAAWPTLATVLLVGAGILLGAAALIGPVLARKRSQNTQALGKRLTQKHVVKRVTNSGRKRELAHLHPDMPDMPPGVPVGKLLFGRHEWVTQSYRQCGAHIWGPGRGKTGSQVQRHALFAPGPYVMTSNKTDGVRQVIAARLTRHPEGRVWVCDPARIYRQVAAPAFVTDLLAGVVDTTTALELADVFQAASKDGADSHSDSHFDSQGRDYLAWCFLAAARSGGTLSQVHGWVSDGETRDVADLLSDYGHPGPVAALKGLSEQPERTRGSVFATAQRMASPMVHDHLMSWFTPSPHMPVFDADHFVGSTDTLVLLSEEKAGPLAALISSLLLHLFKAAKRRASIERSERLPLPLVADLDECGNTVTLPALPDWFTHFGSKGIVISAYFQSPSQGERMYGRDGFAQLWDSAGMRVYGGGVDDARWLADQSKLLGVYDKKRLSHSEDAAGRMSTSVSTQQTDRATVAELANLPEWRAVVRTSNGVTAFVETVPVWNDAEFEKVLELAATINPNEGANL